MTDLSLGPVDPRCVACIGTARCFLDAGHSGSHVSDMRGVVWTDDEARSLAERNRSEETLARLTRERNEAQALVVEQRDLVVSMRAERDEALAELAKALATLERLGVQGC